MEAARWVEEGGKPRSDWIGEVWKMREVVEEK